MPTIKEVARRARVSVGTVSNVLTGAVPVGSRLQKRVLAAIADLDYHPDQIARSLKIRHTKTLGMVVSDITNPFFPQLVRGAEDAAVQHGYLLITFNTDDQVERERNVFSVLRSRRVDGVLLVVSPGDGDFEHIRRMTKAGTPVVCLDRIPLGVAVDSVAVDNIKGAQTAVRHLVQLGHREIAILTGSLKLQTARDRLQGYRAALAEANIEVLPELVIEGDFRQESGYRLGKELLLRHRRPTAVFGSNAMMTVGLLRALDETGLSCPEDVAIATFDDLPLADVFHPRLTSVAQPSYEIGRRGAELLIKRVQTGGAPRRREEVLLDTELKIRESTRARQWRAARR